MKLFQRLLGSVLNNISESPASLDASSIGSPVPSKATTVEKPQSPKPTVSSFQASTLEIPTGSLLITAQRENSVGDATLSRVTVNGKFICDMLEDVLREIPGQPVESWKVYGKTAIPAGIYELTLETSQRFGPNTLTVNRVPGYSGVRCHGGNLAVHTEGCLLFGTRSGPAVISGSQPMLKVMKTLTWEYFSKGAKVFIDIRNPKGYYGLA